MIGRLTNYILWYHTVWVFIFLLVVGVAAGVFFNAILHFHGDDAFLTGLIEKSYCSSLPALSRWLVS